MSAEGTETNIEAPSRQVCQKSNNTKTDWMLLMPRTM